MISSLNFCVYVCQKLCYTIWYDVVMVTGTVIRIGQVNMLESSRVYHCDKCHHQCVVKVTRHGVECGC